MANLDHSCFPHIFDSIFYHSDSVTLNNVRATSRDMVTAVESLFHKRQYGLVIEDQNGTVVCRGADSAQGIPAMDYHDVVKVVTDPKLKHILARIQKCKLLDILCFLDRKEDFMALLVEHSGAPLTVRIAQPFIPHPEDSSDMTHQSGAGIRRVSHIRHPNPLPNLCGVRPGTECSDHVFHFTHFKADGPPIPSFWKDSPLADLDAVILSLFIPAIHNTIVTLVDFNLLAVHMDENNKDKTVKEILADMAEHRSPTAWLSAQMLAVLDSISIYTAAEYRAFVGEEQYAIETEWHTSPLASYPPPVIFDHRPLPSI
jgi:hypothetical protein